MRWLAWVGLLAPWASGEVLQDGRVEWGPLPPSVQVQKDLSIQVEVKGGDGTRLSTANGTLQLWQVEEEPEPSVVLSGLVSSPTLVHLTHVGRRETGMGGWRLMGYNVPESTRPEWIFTFPSGTQLASGGVVSVHMLP